LEELKEKYIKIPNELFETLAKADLNGSQRRIIDVVIRFTFGFKRDKHNISITFISRATNLTTRQIKRELNRLINRNIITVYRKATYISPRIIGLNEAFNTWILSESIPAVVGNEKTPGERLDTRGTKGYHPGEQLDTQDIKKDKEKKPSPKIFTKTDKEYILANYLSKQIADRLNKPLQNEKVLQSWAAEFEKMVRLDKYDLEEMKDVLIFSQGNDFWKKNILSAGKFRKQYISILAQMN